MNVAKTMKKTIADKKVIDEILLQSHGLDEVYERMGYLLSYHIATRSSKKPETIGRSKNELYYDPAIKDMSKDKLVENIVEKGYVAHSFNGYNLKNVKKHGLGSEKTYDKKLSADFDFLCSQLGEGEYTQNQGGGTNEFYYAAPGVKTFHYACGYSPERLWLGPLKQDRKSALPVKVGETKSEYAMRVLKSKVDLLGSEISEEQKNKILDSGSSVIDKLCTHKPVVALIPINSKKYSLTAHYATSKDREGSPQLTTILEKGTGMYSIDDPISMFTENTHFLEHNNLGDLVHCGKIPASELSFFEVDDAFELMQKRAKLKGLQNGEEIDYFTGDKYVPKEPEVSKISKEELDKVRVNDDKKEQSIIYKSSQHKQLEQEVEKDLNQM